MAIKLLGKMEIVYFYLQQDLEQETLLMKKNQLDIIGVEN